MAKITVHGFMVPNIREGVRELAKGKATADQINSFGGCVIVEGTAEVIEDALLNTSGRYHGPDPKDQPNQ